MALGTLFFTGSHGIVRWVGGGMHPLMMAFLSNLFSALFFVPWIARHGVGVLRTRHFPLHALRALFNVGSITCWYWALTLTPLADATALAAPPPYSRRSALFSFWASRCGSGAGRPYL